MINSIKGVKQMYNLPDILRVSIEQGFPGWDLLISIGGAAVGGLIAYFIAIKQMEKTDQARAEDFDKQRKDQIKFFFQQLKISEAEKSIDLIKEVEDEFLDLFGKIPEYLNDYQAAIAECTEGNKEGLEIFKVNTEVLGNKLLEVNLEYSPKVFNQLNLIESKITSIQNANKIIENEMVNFDELLQFFKELAEILLVLVESANDLKPEISRDEFNEKHKLPYKRLPDLRDQASASILANRDFIEKEYFRLIIQLNKEAEAE